MTYTKYITLSETFLKNYFTSEVLKFYEWKLDFLCDYIECNHHSYIRSIFPKMMLKSRALLKNKMIYGEVVDQLEQLNLDFEIHMQKEEKLVFPYIRNMAKMMSTERFFEIPPFGSILKPAEVMMNEHKSADENLKRIRNLCGDYKLISDENENKITFFGLLKEFERDFHLHIHIENNLLFPKAINLEKKLKKLYFKN